MQFLRDNWIFKNRTKVFQSEAGFHIIIGMLNFKCIKKNGLLLFNQENSRLPGPFS
jgi:hypothetical protein